MELSDCNPRLGDDGALVFVYPGSRVARGEIGTWSSGFDTRTIRNGRKLLSYFWYLDVLSCPASDPLPDAVAAFLEEIPTGVRECVGKYTFGQCFMLHHAAAHQEARDLLRSNPNLLWLLARAVYDGKIDQDHVARLCRRKQLQILKRLVPSATNATLKLLARVETDFGALFEARVATTVLSHSGAVEALAHQREVPYRLLGILERHSCLAQPSLVALILRELESGQRSPSELGRYLREVVGDIARLASVLRIDRPERAIAQCRTAADLARLHDRWTQRMNSKVPAFLVRGNRSMFRFEPPVDPLQLVFPPPPFPDGDDVKAIRTPEDLIREGAQQGHCVASYAQDVADGKVYIYRLLRPSRATLEIRKTDDGWKIGQLKLARNRAPNDDTRRAVRSWMRRSVAAEKQTRDFRGMFW